MNDSYTSHCDASSDCFQLRNVSQLENTCLYLLKISVGMISHGKCIKQYFFSYVLEYVVCENTAVVWDLNISLYHEWEPRRTYISCGINTSVYSVVLCTTYNEVEKLL